MLIGFIWTHILSQEHLIGSAGSFLARSIVMVEQYCGDVLDHSALSLAHPFVDLVIGRVVRIARQNLLASLLLAHHNLVNCQVGYDRHVLRRFRHMYIAPLQVTDQNGTA